MRLCPIKYGVKVALDSGYDYISLLHFDDTDGSSTFTDEMGIVWTRRGGAQIDTSQSYFGGSSFYPNGGGYPEFSQQGITGSVPAIGADDFTISLWIRIASFWSEGSWNTYVFSGNAATDALTLQAPGGGVHGLRLSFAPDNSGLQIRWESAPISKDVWHHVEISRSSGNIRIFLDGVKGDESPYATSIPAMPNFIIGQRLSSSPEIPFPGWIDEFCIIRGALHESDFTPPAAPFPNP